MILAIDINYCDRLRLWLLFSAQPLHSLWRAQHICRTQRAASPVPGAFCPRQSQMQADPENAYLNAVGHHLRNPDRLSSQALDGIVAGISELVEKTRVVYVRKSFVGFLVQRNMPSGTHKLNWYTIFSNGTNLGETPCPRALKWP